MPPYPPQLHSCGMSAFQFFRKTLSAPCSSGDYRTKEFTTRLQNTNNVLPLPRKTSAQIPIEAAKQTSPITVLLTHHDVAVMDEIAAAIRRNNGAVIGRSALLRAVVAATLPYHKDWLHCRSVAGLQNRLATRL